MNENENKKRTKSMPSTEWTRMTVTEEKKTERETTFKTSIYEKEDHKTKKTNSWKMQISESISERIVSDNTDCATSGETLGTRVN